MHHPLTRQPTRDSLRSWWSDRNPLGPNIDLHAAAKPLMRFMYRRDVLAFIAKTRGSPLSRENMEIYSSYLAYKYVSSSTKTTILIHLQARVEDDSDADAVGDSLVLHLADELLSSPNAGVRRPMCRILAILARRETTGAAILRRNLCPRLVSLLHDTDVEVIKSAVQGLRWLSKRPDGAQAAVDANVLHSLAELFDSGNGEIRAWMCDMLEDLARLPATATAVLELLVLLSFDDNPCIVDGAVKLLEELGHHAITERLALRQVVSLLRSEDPPIFQKAARILSHKIKSSEGAQIVVELNLLECLPELVDSPNAAIRNWTWDILQHLTHHETTAPAALGQLVTFLRHDNPDDVVSGAMEVLSYIATSPEGAHAAVNAGVLTSMIQLLESSTTGIKVRTCELLAKLGLHKSARDAGWQAKPCRPLVSLLRDEKQIVVDRAANALAILIRSEEGAHAAVDAKVVDCMDELLASSDPQICSRACQIIEALANHGTTAPAVLNVKVCIRLTSLLRHPDPPVRESAMAALAQIYEVPGGLAAISASDFLAVVGHLMRFVNHKVPFKDALQHLV
ncbi:armadillo-type protein [Mycena latifolia]|nr:armadillo-type protein [Mycena latifolia]